MEDGGAVLRVAEVDVADGNGSLQGRDRDVAGTALALLGGPVHHVSSQFEVAGLDLELLPGLHQLHQWSGDAVADDSKGEQSSDREFVAGDQPDPHHHRGDAGEVADAFGEGSHGFAAHLELEVFADEAAVAVLEGPAGFQLGILGFDRLDSSDRLGEIAVGVDALVHHSIDLMFDDGVGDQGQHDEQRQAAEGDQGEQRVEAEQHRQIEQAEAEIHQGGQRFADQEVPEPIELGEVVGDLAHGPCVKEPLGQAHQPIEDRFAGVHVHPVGDAGEDQAAHGRDQGLDNAGQHQNHADADHGIERIAAGGLGIDQTHHPQGGDQGQHIHRSGAGQHFDQFAPMGAQVGGIPAPAEALLLAPRPPAQQQQPQGCVALGDGGRRHPQRPQLRVQQPQLAVGIHAIHKGQTTLVFDHRRCGHPLQLRDWDVAEGDR